MPLFFEITILLIDKYQCIDAALLLIGRLESIDWQSVEIVGSILEDSLLLSYICEYLSMRDQLAVSALNRRVKNSMEEHFSNLLQAQGMHRAPGKTAIHQLHFYYDRCLRIFKTNRNEDKQDMKEVKKKRNEEEPEQAIQIHRRTISRPFKFAVVTHFEVGPVYTVSLDNRGRATIFRTNHIVGLADNKDKPIFVVEPDVAILQSKSDKLLVVKRNGQVYLWETDKKSNEILQKKTHLVWTNQVGISHAYSSFSYALLEPSQPLSRLQLLSLLFGQAVVGQQQDFHEGEMWLIGMSLIGGGCWIVRVPAAKLISVAVGQRQAYLVNERHQCFVVEFEHINEGTRQIHAKRFHPLANCKIVKISSGYTFFLAIQRNVENVEEWNVEKVANWLRDIGLADYVRIARAERIDGKRLIGMERKYMENVLGINKLNVQQKLLLSIEQAVEGSQLKDQLWVWGKNQFGQLALTHSNYIAVPQRIKMDFLQSRDRIDNIFCGWQQTYLRTHRGKIYATLITSEKKKKKPEEKEEKQERERELLQQQQDFRRQPDETRLKNKKRKKTEDFKQEKKPKNHHKRFEEEQRWVESPAGKAFLVQGYKQFSFYMQCAGQSNFEPVKQKKLRTSKAVIDRILWDDNLDKTEFRIGLIDKDMGTIEVSTFQIQTFDYKESSIRYIKKRGELVWDRDSKIDYL